jgi:aldehyde dehydrogenase (NAD+)
MGRSIAQTVAKRLARSLLLLGGNNAMILAPSADLDLAVRTIIDSVVASSGQRCTSLRRLIVHQSVQNQVLAKLTEAFNTIKVGHPNHEDTRIGPLIDADAWWQMQAALQAAEQQGGKVICGGQRVEHDVPPHAYYARPAIVAVPGNLPIVCEETFAPILYVMPYTEMLDALDLHNEVSQGLSSTIFTRDLTEAEWFIGACGSDCGIANVNTATIGIEIGGAFGGEKDTGSGREAGSDVWKQFMRRSTSTIFGG